MATEQLVVEIDGVKTPNFELLEEKYGSEFVKSLKISLEHCRERKQDWKLEILDEGKYFITFVFANEYTANVIEVQKSAKRVTGEFVIGRSTCKTLIELIDSI